MENELAQLAEDHPLRQWGPQTTTESQHAEYTTVEDSEESSQKAEERPEIPIDFEIKWEEHEESGDKNDVTDRVSDSHDAQIDSTLLNKNDIAQNSTSREHASSLVDVSEDRMQTKDIIQGDTRQDDGPKVASADSGDHRMENHIEQDVRCPPSSNNLEAERDLDSKSRISNMEELSKQEQIRNERTMQLIDNNAAITDRSSKYDEQHNQSMRETSNWNDDGDSEYGTDSDDGSVEQVTISLASLMQSSKENHEKDRHEPETKPEVIECSLTDLVLGTKSATIRNILARWKGQPTEEASINATRSDDKNHTQESLENGATESDRQENQDVSQTTEDDTKPTTTSNSSSIETKRFSFDNVDLQEKMKTKAEKIYLLQKKLNAYAPSFEPFNATTRDPYEFSPDEYYQPYSNGYSARVSDADVDSSPVPSTTNFTTEHSQPEYNGIHEYENTGQSPSYFSPVVTDSRPVNPYASGGEHSRQVTTYTVNGTVYFKQ